MIHYTKHEATIMRAIKLITNNHFQMPQGVEGKIRVKPELVDGVLLPRIYGKETKVPATSNLKLVGDIDKIPTKLLLEIGKVIANNITISPRLLPSFKDPEMRADWLEEQINEQIQDDGTEMHLSDETWGVTYNPIITALKEAKTKQSVVDLLESINLEEIVESNIEPQITHLTTIGFIVVTNMISITESVKLNRLYRMQKEIDMKGVMIPTYIEPKMLHNLLYKEIIDETKEKFTEFLEKYATSIELADKLRIKQFINTTSYWTAAQLIYTSLMNWVDTFNTSEAGIDTSETDDAQRVNEVKETLFETLKAAIIQMQDNERVWKNIEQAMILHPVSGVKYNSLLDRHKNLFIWKPFNEVLKEAKEKKAEIDKLRAKKLKEMDEN